MPGQKSASSMKAKLLIMRVVTSSLLVWAICYLYIASSSRIQDVGMEKLWSEGKRQKVILSKKLAFAEKLGSSEDVIEARSKWMLFLLRLSVVDESLKEAKILEKELTNLKRMPIEKKFTYFEEIAVVYRSAEKFDLALPLYKKLIFEIESSDTKEKKSLIARAKNNMAVNEFFRGLSTHAPSNEHFAKRVEYLNDAKQSFSQLQKEIQSKSSGVNDSTRAIVQANLGEANLEIKYALLRKDEYDKVSK